MPRTNPDGSRNYEYDKKYQARPEQKKRRAARGRARYSMIKAGANLAGKDVHHKNGNPNDNNKANLAATSVAHNRGLKTAAMSKKNKAKYSKERAK